MADEKVNMGPEENKPPETQSPPGQGDLPPLEENNAPAVSGEDKAAPDHVEPDPPSADKHTQQTVLPGMGEDTPAPSGKVINLSDIQAADKGGKEASTTAPEKKAPEADQPKKRRGRPPKEQAAVSAGKKEKAAEPRTGRPSKVDKAAREEAPPAVRDKVSRGKKADKGKETGSGGAPASKSAKAVKPGKAAPVKEAAVPPPEINLPPTPDVPPRPVEEGKIVYLKMAELHPFHTFREHPYKVQDDKAMDDLVGTIKEHGIMTPATVRPEKDGKGYCRVVYDAGYSPICPMLYLPLFLNDAVPEEHKNGIDMGRDLLRRSRVLVVCGHTITESMKNDIAVAQRLGITATTLEGILTVKGQGRR